MQHEKVGLGDTTMIVPYNYNITMKHIEVLSGSRVISYVWERESVW